MGRNIIKGYYMKKSIFDPKDLIGTVQVEKGSQTVFDILSRVVTNDPMRPYSRAIRYFPEERTLVVTDGRRLVVVDCEKLPPSIMENIPHKDAWLSYEKRLLSVYSISSLGNRYPEYKRVIPDDSIMVTNGLEYAFIEKHTKNSRFLAEEAAAFSVPRFFRDHDGIMINLDFIKDLFGMIYQVKVNSNENTRKEKPVVFFNDLVKVVVMPVRPPAFYPDFYSCDTKQENGKAGEHIA